MEWKIVKEWEKSGTLCHKAYTLAKKYHEDQVDKAGNDYIEHLLVVASTVMAQDEIVVALLHDIIEDTSCTAIKLIEYGIPGRLVASIEAITRLSGETYDEFILRVRKDPIARTVKLVDLQHNLDASRFDDPLLYPESLRKRYEKAVGVLLEGL